MRATILGVVIGMVCAREARADTSCADAVEHVLQVMASEGAPSSDDPSFVDSMRPGMMDVCAKATPEQVACVMAATNSGDMAVCMPSEGGDGPTLSVPLPAISADGKTLALPVEMHVMGESHEYVDLVPLGKSSGQRLDLWAHYVDTSGAGPPVFAGPMTEDHSADVEAALQGYTAVAAGPAAADGVTASVGGSYKKKTVKLLAGKKKLGKLKLVTKDGDEIDAVGIAVIRGKTSWVYVASQEIWDVETRPTEWHALKVKLPKPR